MDSILNDSVIFRRYRFRMMEKTAYLHDKAARLRGDARIESDPGVCRALLTRAGACEALARSLEDDLSANVALTRPADRPARHA